LLSSAFTEKGLADSSRINVEEIDKLVKTLKPYINVPNHDLPPVAKTALKKFISFVGILSGTNAYDVLVEIVDRNLESVTDVIPGTPGAYLIGCRLSHDNPIDDIDPACSAICAGSIPIDNDQALCTNTVVIATYKDSEFKISVVRLPESDDNKELAHVYVNFTSYGSFPGFSDQEKALLKSYGIKRVYLRGYAKTGLEFVELHDGVVPVDDLKCRNGSGSSSDSNLLWIVLLIIVILVIASFVVMRNRK
jgi:hypothetical protein